MPQPNRTINEKGLALLEKCEGLRQLAYKDVAGVWTIGYGHTGPDVRAGLFITPEGAEKLLAEDLQLAQIAVSKAVRVPLTDNEFSALVCFTFNVGATALAKSTLLRYLNQGRRKAAADEFLRWDRAAGVQRAGLTARRSAERALFLQED